MNHRHRKSWSRQVLLTVMLLVGWPVCASAHLVTTGLGPVYDGIGHLLMTPEDLISVLAIAMLAGLRGKAPGRYALFFFPVAWFAGGLLGVSAPSIPLLPLPAFTILALGILIAADLELSDRLFTLIVLAVGLMHGALNGVALKSGPALLGIIGISAALFVLIALFTALVVSLKKPWTRITIRVAGSWVAAIGMLMFGWMFRGQV